MNATAQKSVKPVAPTSRIGYVFKDKSEKEFTDPLKAYEGLALSQCGNYPLGANGGFHGGIHFSANTKGTFSQEKGVRCIADGEVVAYRIDRRYPDATPADSSEKRPKDGSALRPYSTGFVLVRHRLQPPGPTLPAPPKESAITSFGTDLCDQAGRPQAWLPQGATLRLTGKVNHNRTWAQVDELTNPDQAVWSVKPQPDLWARVSDLMLVHSARSGLARLLEPNEYRISPAADRPDPRQVRANCDARLQQDEHRKQCAATANPPTLTWYSLYMHLGDLASYEAHPKRPRPPWWQGGKPAGRIPRNLDAVTVLDSPVPIRQGQTVGFPGEDVPANAWAPSSQPVSRELLHLEAFSAEDVPGFIAACREWAKQIPEDKCTQLALKAGDELRLQPKADAAIVAMMRIEQAFPLGALKQAKDAEGRIWRQVSVRTTGNGMATGWIEETGRRVSPWLWRGFQVIEEASNPAGTWWDDVQQFADYLRGSGVRPKETPLFAKIRSRLDSNKDGELEGAELTIALKDRQLSNLIGGLIVRHRSAWDVPSWGERFGAIDELIEMLGSHEDSVRYRASEKERVRKLDWWGAVAAQLPGFPVDSDVYHFHPVALAGAFGSTCPEQCQVDVYEMDTNPGPFIVSKETFEFILEKEGYGEQPYVPGGASGVTIGYGYDLGQQSEEQMRRDLAGLYTDKEIDELAGMVGKQGNAARNVVAQVRHITIDKENALRLAVIMKRRYAQQVVDVYPAAVDLHPHCQGALLSLVINRGNSLQGESRKEMRDIQSDLAGGTTLMIPSRFRGMKRLWEEKEGMRGLVVRREEEAKFFETGVKCNCWR